MGRETGIEPATTGTTNQRSTNWATPAIKKAGAPDRTRTYYPRIRNPMLYPDELQAHHMVGVEGFEPPTSCSQSRRATRLRYTPNVFLWLHDSNKTKPWSNREGRILLNLWRIRQTRNTFLSKFGQDSSKLVLILNNAPIKTVTLDP